MAHQALRESLRSQTEGVVGHTWCAAGDHFVFPTASERRVTTMQKQTQQHQRHIAIIGGGITGVTSAYALAKAGFRVTLIEKNRYAGMETSYANGGQLSASNAEVWTHPSTIVKLSLIHI